MVGKFAYSFDRDTFRGAFDSRQAAQEAAFAALKQREDMPPGIFVGQWCEPNPQADHHADSVIADMKSRWKESGAEGKFLGQVTEQQAADLDYALESTIRAWLTKHELLPKPTRVRAVSEHRIPNVHHVADSTERETSVIGEA